mmetsp:Transcript_101096/g.326304  ORF Transcript_101096/g.326304 Transcript_101096/m.326304 type:complete len:276 (-) Transcript_101096:440-1267(-)
MSPRTRQPRRAHHQACRWLFRLWDRNSTALASAGPVSTSTPRRAAASAPPACSATLSTRRRKRYVHRGTCAKSVGTWRWQRLRCTVAPPSLQKRLFSSAQSISTKMPPPGTSRRLYYGPYTGPKSRPRTTRRARRSCPARARGLEYQPLARAAAAPATRRPPAGKRRRRASSTSVRTQHWPRLLRVSRRCRARRWTFRRACRPWAQSTTTVANAGLASTSTARRAATSGPPACSATGPTRRSRSFGRRRACARSAGTWRWPLTRRCPTAPTSRRP